MRIIESAKFNIDVTECKDYKGNNAYVIRYGLECKRRDSIEDAMIEFHHCLNHAMSCEGIVLEDCF